MIAWAHCWHTHCAPGPPIHSLGTSVSNAFRVPALSCGGLGTQVHMPVLSQDTFAHLSCPSAPPTSLGTPIHTFTMCQCRSATWQSGHDFSQVCRVPVLPSSDLGTLCHTSRSQGQPRDSLHTPGTHLLCISTATWWPGNTCLHVCCISEPATGGQHMPLHFRNISAHIMPLGNGMGAHMSAHISA